MLAKSTYWKGMVVHATDGDIGKVTHFFFDDETWHIRYLVVETGNWLSERPVLISPLSVISTDQQAQRLDVSLTMDQVAQSPDINTHLPVSRQHEESFLGYYGYPYYWSEPKAPVPDHQRMISALSRVPSEDILTELLEKQSADSHLRDIDAVTGYQVQHESPEEAIGKVDGFIVDEDGWAIRYIEVATGNMLSGKKVLIPPAWVQRISWDASTMYLDLLAAAVKSCPEYLESAPITREYESELCRHLGQPEYWRNEAQGRTAMATANF